MKANVSRRDVQEMAYLSLFFEQPRISANQCETDTPSAKSITHVIDNNYISKLVIQLAPN